MFQSIRHILIVDEDAAFAAFLKLYLRRQGFLPDVACDEKQAIREIERASRSGIPFDLVVTGMPQTSCAGFLLSIRERHPEVSAIVLLSSGEGDGAGDVLRAGMDDFGTKELAANEVMGLIRRVDGMRRERFGEPGRM